MMHDQHRQCSVHYVGTITDENIVFEEVLIDLVENLLTI